MLIKNHLLVGDVDGIEVIQRPENDYGLPISPEVVVIHYAVTESLAGTVNVLKSRDYVSCHLAIDGWRDGERSVAKVAQMIPFNRKAFHAGESIWQGHPSVNSFSIGIEVSNPGPLIEDGKGGWITSYGKPWHGDVVKARHKSGKAPRNWTGWAPFTEEESDLLCHLVELLRQTYPTITDVVGHDDISPGRKFDPGPCFDVGIVRHAVFHRE